MAPRPGQVEILERTAILAGLRRGAVDVPMGINPLRDRVEALDVALVAPLGAGKEAYVKTGTCLARTIGRAARTAGDRRGKANGLRREGR